MLLLKTLEKALSFLIICLTAFIASAMVFAIGGPFIICLLFVVLLFYRKQISFYMQDRRVKKELKRMEKHIRNNKE
jgi:uncharacterized membrane protein YciS (DUF1049 family)